MVSLDNGDVKLIDFGLSKIIKNKNNLTNTEKSGLEIDEENLNKIICEFDKLLLFQTPQL